MVLLRNPLCVDSGDVSEIDTSRFFGKCVLFFDNDLGLLCWDGSEWLTASGEYTRYETNIDLISDGLGGYYLDLTGVAAVYYCSVNGVELDGTLDDTYLPPRYFGFANTDTAIIKLIIKK